MLFPIFIVNGLDGIQLVQSPFSGTFEVVFEKELVKAVDILLEYLLGIAEGHGRDGTG